MTEKELIAQLKNLRRISLRERELSLLKQKIVRRLEQENYDANATHESEPNGFSPRAFAFMWARRPALMYGASIVLVLAIGIMMSYGPATAKLKLAITQVRMAATDNRYEKAKLALNLAQSEFQRVKTAKTPVSARSADELKSVTDLAYLRLNDLNLAGEPGEYTTDQCKELHRQYDEYLHQMLDLVEQEMIKNENDSSLREKLTYLKEQILEYEETVDAKLGMY